MDYIYGLEDQMVAVRRAGSLALLKLAHMLEGQGVSRPVLVAALGELGTDPDQETARIARCACTELLRSNDEVCTRFDGTT